METAQETRIVRAVRDDEARVNVTWQQQNGELPDPVFRDSTESDVRRMVTEAVRSGNVPGIAADPAADFTDFVVERFGPTDARPYNVVFVRPKTAFGSLSDRDLKRQILEGAIVRDVAQDGKQLTGPALREAVDVAEQAWRGNTYMGDAAKAGLNSVVKKVYK